MATGSSIEWTEATWNPSTGCTKISPGCKNCYAERMAGRQQAMGSKKYAAGFEYTEHQDTLQVPIRWARGRMIFVNSMSDMFHENATTAFVASCFYSMLLAPQHTYQILTKRPDRMAEFSMWFEKATGVKIPPNIWMGTSIESSFQLDRLQYLRWTRCHTRFVSFEPLIGDIGPANLSKIDWAIIGGESGPGHRPVRREWITELIDTCRRQKTAVFFKQWGGATPKAGGREIDGRTYDEYPKTSKVPKPWMIDDRDVFVGKVVEAAGNTVWTGPGGKAWDGWSGGTGGGR
ncbi:MAG: phage Gp37/Gp68 family protein [Pirellulales bacterium]|nr:phage Gp37/Gp68 family protein [Pirellulales bacterium]MDA8040804.1 phage Gp37/Gp68 family protein [Pirellulales bacterium]